MAADFSRVVAEVRKALAANDLTALFESVLVWDDGLTASSVKFGTASANYVASKARVPVWLISADTEAEVDALDKRLRKESFERLLVWQSQQGRIWLFPEKTSSGIRRSKTTEANLEAVAQRLARLRFEPGEQPPTVLDVKNRLQRSFSVEKVTEKFYSEFKDIHDRLGGRRSDAKLLPLLRGLPDVNASRWYASILLNRLMFLYFLQRKGFLDNDTNYLQNRMLEVQKLYGKGKFYTFYTSFLLPLFQEAIGSPRWDALSQELKRLVGRVPFLNGGVFAHHQLEKEHTIELEDEIFTDIFRVFDGYRWHLDESEHSEEHLLPQINPDILGHIFERYVNEGDEETGAFYTPTDVTRWMTTRTIGSTVLQRLVELGVDLGTLIAKDPERYLPPEHFVGRAEAEEWLEEHPKLGSKHAADWAKPVAAGRGLPTETVWEVRDRLKHAARMTKELSIGTIGTPDALFSFNLNNPVLISDAMRTLTPEKLQKYWEQLFSITVIDPTCGSGAFLLAALAFLEELALDALDRADEFSADAKIQTPSFAKEFKAKNLGQRRLSIRTRFIIRSLYGADLSGEAVEIARLRLYLALVATTSEYEDLRPLPDLEFNLAEGNLLIGVNSVNEMESLIGNSMWSVGEVGEVRKRITEVSNAINAFNAEQQGSDNEQHKERKLVALQKSNALKEQLDIALHKAIATGQSYSSWTRNHEPLHYLAQFPEIMLRGGFDVVIGNPPYIRKSKIKAYSIPTTKVNKCPDIYADCTLRAAALVKKDSVLAFVLPYSYAWGPDFHDLREAVQSDGATWIANFMRNPDALFRGVGVRNTVLFLHKGSEAGQYTSDPLRWTSAFRSALLPTLRFAQRSAVNEDATTVRSARRIGKAMYQASNALRKPSPGSNAFLYFKKTALYWMPVSPFPLRTLTRERIDTDTGQLVKLGLVSQDEAYALFAILASRVGFLQWILHSDNFAVNANRVLDWKVLPHDPARTRSWARIGQAASETLAACADAHLWTPYAGYWVESLDVRTLDLSQIEAEFLQLIDEGSNEDGFCAFYDSQMKSTGERPGTERGLDPPKRNVGNSAKK